MARPRTPTKVLELRGAFVKDPQRKRAEPKPTGPLGPPPKNFDPALTNIWEELAEMAPAGVLEKADRVLVELCCRIVFEFRQPKAMQFMTAARLNLLVSCLARMGMTPSDRSKVGVQTKKEIAAGRDELAEFAAQSRANIRIPN